MSTAVLDASTPGRPEAVVPRRWRIAGREVVVVGPNIRDPRVHLSLTILTVHALGQIWLGFDVSIVQVAAAVLTGAVMDLAWTLRRTGVLAWPASGLSTGVGVALVFRVIGTENGDYWSGRDWQLFVAVVAFSLLTKYVIRYRGSHVFNPSNIGLVVAFLIFGSGKVEPLDFWWAPLGWAMALAYVVVAAGGISLNRRLDLLGMGVAFWTTLAAGTAILMVQGHCMTTRWSFAPVCGRHFWWIVMTSPEVLIFMFFMITDPRTVPAGRVARIAFGAVTGALSTALLAPWDTEFGAKVGLLAGLVVACALRPIFDRVFPAPHSPEDRLGPYIRRLAGGDRTTSGPGRVLVRVGAVVAVTAVLGVGVAAAGLPNARIDRAVGLETTGVVPAVPQVDPASLPVVTIDPEVAGLGTHLATPEGAQELATTLMWNLQVEAEAIAEADPGLLVAVDHGERLLDLEAAIAAGERTVTSYHFDSLHLEVVFPGGPQSGANAGLVAEGWIEEIELGPDGAEIARATKPLATTFSLRQTTSGRWMTTDTLSIADS